MAKASGGGGIGSLVEDLAPQLGGPLDRNGHAILGQITGVEWNQETDTWKRIDKNGDEILLSRAWFDDCLPWAGMRRVNLAVDGTINAVYGEANYKEDGSNGRVMVQIPKFWVKSEETVANKYRWWISDHAVTGFEVHPAFNQRTASAPADYIYVSAYEASLMDDAGTLKMDSKSGEQPWTGGELDSLGFDSGSVEFVVGETLTGAISGATGVVLDYHVATGTWGGGDAAGTVYLKQVSATAFQAEDLDGSTGGANMASATGANVALALNIDDARGYGTAVGSYWGIMNIWTMAALQVLFMVEYGNMDSQTAIGRGVVDKASGVGFAGELTAASSINDNLGDNGTGTGTGTDGLVPIAHRWIENLWGNVWKFIDGYEAVDAAYHILKATGGWTNSGPSIWGAGDYDASTAAPITTDGYASNIVYEAALKYLLLASAVAGSDSTCIPDYFYAHDAGETNILLASGGWNYASDAGLGCLSSRDVASHSDRKIGARLEFIG